MTNSTLYIHKPLLRFRLINIESNRHYLLFWFVYGYKLQMDYKLKVRDDS